MCFFKTPSPPPPPPPLPPAPPPPLAPQPPRPTPDASATETDINPQVREAKSKKARNEMSQGTSELRIPLEGQINTGGNPGSDAGGLNK